MSSKQHGSWLRSCFCLQAWLSILLGSFSFGRQGTCCTLLHENEFLKYNPLQQVADCKLKLLDCHASIDLQSLLYFWD